MKISTTQLLQELTELTRTHLREAEQLRTLPFEDLNTRISENSWSALECIEHLNLYGRFYLPEIERRIRASGSRPEPEFRSGWIGNYFANMMLPREKPNKMKTFASMNPLHRQLDKQTLDIFAGQQEKLLQLLGLAEQVNLNTVKTNISISRFIQLKLGDTFRVVIYHNKRHLLQAKKVLEQTKSLSRDTVHPSFSL